MKVLVTGGAGFIGSHLVDALIQQGYQVVVVDNLSMGRLENINPAATFYQADICNPELEGIFEKERPELVNHQAAQTVIQKSMEDPVFDANQNILGSLNLMLLQSMPAATILGVDFDPTLLALAKHRLGAHASRVHLIQADLRERTWAKLVPEPVEAVVSATCATRKGLVAQMTGMDSSRRSGRPWESMSTTSAERQLASIAETRRGCR